MPKRKDESGVAMVAHDLTKDELAERSRELATAVQERAGLDNDRKVAAAASRLEIKRLDEEIKKLARAVRTRKEDRPAEQKEIPFARGHKSEAS